MKNLILVALAATCLAVAPAAAQTTVRVGTQLSNLNNDVNGAASVDVSGLNLVNGVSAGVEARSDFDRNGVDELTARAGPALNLGQLTLTPTAQLGVASIRNNGREVFATFGAGVGVRLPLVTNLALAGNVNYRQAFTGREDYRLTEASGGLEFALTPNVTLDARYFQRRGTLDSSGVGVGVSFRF